MESHRTGTHEQNKPNESLEEEPKDDQMSDKRECSEELCQRCELSFINTEDLREHIQSEHIDNPINCRICSKVCLC